MGAMPGATSKCGAEGLGCFSLPDGRGLAVKVVDGADRAQEPAGLAALEGVVGADAVSDELRRIARPADQNDAGDTVGELLAVRRTDPSRPPAAARAGAARPALSRPSACGQEEHHDAGDHDHTPRRR